MMSHTTATVDAFPKARRNRNATSSARNFQRPLASLELLQLLYEQSTLSETINKQLQNISKMVAITRILSLGLGSLFANKGQSRRLKQLTILLAMRASLLRLSGTVVEIYAQDPTFTRVDEVFLTSLGIHIQRTQSGAELGEAATSLSPSTLVYSPFLTLEAYEQVLVKSGLPAPTIFGDDFNALLNKWPKHSDERKQVDTLMKSGLSKYRRRAISGDGFWAEEDGTFPMAVYEEIRVQRGRGKAKI